MMVWFFCWQMSNSSKQMDDISISTEYDTYGRLRTNILYTGYKRRCHVCTLTYVYLSTNNDPRRLLSKYRCQKYQLVWHALSCCQEHTIHVQCFFMRIKTKQKTCICLRYLICATIKKSYFLWIISIRGAVIERYESRLSSISDIVSLCVYLDTIQPSIWTTHHIWSPYARNVVIVDGSHRHCWDYQLAKFNIHDVELIVLTEPGPLLARATNSSNSSFEVISLQYNTQ